MEFNIFYLSICFFIISNIFLLTQGIINFKFFRFNDREIITERTLFEQFSYEVYSSINSPFIFTSINNESNKCSNPMEINLNLKSYFDCRGIYSKDLSSSCQDSIVSNYSSCTNNGDIDYSNYDYLNDIRKDCIYFSKFSHKTIKLNNKYYCGQNIDSLNYEQLLSNSVINSDEEGNYNSCPEGYIKCGILDTMGNILCIQGNSCPNKYISYDSMTFSGTDIQENNIIASIIVSEEQPLNHNWDIIVKEKYEKIDDEASIKRRSVSKADFKLFDKETDETYKKIDGQFELETIITNPDNYRFNGKQKLNIYVRNYIGFKNVKELNKFKKKFNENDHRDNHLYKLSSSGHNPIITIVFSTVFLFLSIAFLIFYIKIEKIFSEDIKKIILFIFAGISILFLIAALIIIIAHFVQYPMFTIDMDERMKKVLDEYNKRTLNCQLYRIISLALNTISLILAIIYFKLKKPEAQAVPA